MKNSLLYKIVLTGCLLASFITMAAADPCPLNISGKEKTNVGIYIRDINSGKVITSINADTVFVPASITKSLTCASVLSQLPPDYRFTTKISTEGNVVRGVLNGNLMIRCSGDATIESSHFKEYNGLPDSIAASLARAGIDSIAGRIIFDYPFPLEQAAPRGWMAEDLTWPYGAVHHAVNYADNKMSISIPSMKTIPVTSRLKVERIDGATIKQRHGSDVLFVGRGAKGGNTIAMPDPSDAFETAIISALKRKSIGIGNAKITPSNSIKAIYTHRSPEISKIMKSLMFRSDNLMAESMLRLLAPERTRESATKRELSLWDSRGLNVKPIFVEDGSGLSRRDRLSPRFMADMLEWMYRSADGPLYLSFFPRAGRDGTMRNVMAGTALDGIMATKTGSMRGVQSFAGYILDPKSKLPTHIVVVMVNGFTCDRDVLKKAIGKYIIDALHL